MATTAPPEECSCRVLFLAPAMRGHCRRSGSGNRRARWLSDFAGCSAAKGVHLWQSQILTSRTLEELRMTFIPSVILVVAVVILVAIYMKMRQRDHLDVMIKKRQPTSKLVSRAEYSEGMENIPVALAL